MLKIIDVQKYFTDGTGHSFQALKNINLEFPKGSFTVLVGGNGSGKSTLLNLIAGNISCDHGKVLLDNQPIHNLSDYQRARFLSRMFQDPSAGTAGDLTILENFRLAALRRKRKGLNVGINSSFKREVQQQLSKLGLGLEDKVDNLISQLSGGQRQAITLLMATFDPPQLFLLDEPTAALDPKAAELLIKLADQTIRAHPLTAIMVTHNMREAMQYGDRLIQLHQGEIRRDLSPSQKSRLDPLEVMQWFHEE